MLLALKIAIRFLKSSKGQTFLIVFGIAVGVSVQIFIGSLIQSLQRDLIDTTIGSQSHITVRSEGDDELISDYNTLVRNISENVEGVKYVSAVVDSPALISLDENNFNILLRGLDFEEADGIYNIKQRLIRGNLPQNLDEIIIGTNLANDSGIEINDEIEILIGFDNTRTLKVTGIFDLQVATLNASWVLTTTETAQSAFDFEQKVSSIEMQVEDVFAADVIAVQIEDILQQDLAVDNWKAQNASLLSGLNGQSVSSLMIQVFVMISVMLGIASVLAISAVQKSRQIGILKAMGIQDAAASQIFLFQGFILGIAGAITGVLLGVGLGLSFTTFALNPDGTPVVPLFFDYTFIAVSALLAVFVATFAAIIPARKSSSLNPIEVIRNA